MTYIHSGESASPPSNDCSAYVPLCHPPKASQDFHRVRTSLASAEAFILEREQHCANLSVAFGQQAALAADSSSTLHNISIYEQELQTLLRSFVLDAASLHKLRILLVSLKMLRTYHQLVAGNDGRSAAVALVIREQPIPKVVFKGKQLDLYSVQVITTPGFRGGFEKMQAVIVPSDASSSSTPTVLPATPLENDTAKVEAFQRIAMFDDLKLTFSSRMAPLALRFRLQYEASPGTQAVAETEASLPMIAITNESQWVDAAGKLMISEAFEGATEVPFARFANTLNAHFLAATRQELGRPMRPLSDADWCYLHSKFFGAGFRTARVDFLLTAVRRLGTRDPTLARAGLLGVLWPGLEHAPIQAAYRCPLEHGVRAYSSHYISSCTRSRPLRLVFGFSNKDTCQALLQAQDVGSFVIRFSETMPGLFTVAYASDDPFDRVKHYLVKPEDISLNKTLPDLLREKPQFQHVLQLDCANGSVHRYPRDTVFASYFSRTRKAPPTSTGTGYVHL